MSHNSEGHIMGRDFFLEYIHDLKADPAKMANADFKTQATDLMAEMDALRGG